MGDRYALLLRNECRGKGGIDIPYHNDKIRFLLLEDFFQSHHDRSYLLAIASGSDAKVDVRPRHPKLLEEKIAHLPIIMLPGMNEDVRNALLSELLYERRSLHEIRARDRKS